MGVAPIWCRHVTEREMRAGFDPKESAEHELHSEDNGKSSHKSVDPSYGESPIVKRCTKKHGACVYIRTLSADVHA